MSTFEALGLFYTLNDGLFWNAQDKLVGFRSRNSAHAFKLANPFWTVKYEATK